MMITTMNDQQQQQQQQLGICCRNFEANYRCHADIVMTQQLHWSIAAAALVGSNIGFLMAVPVSACICRKLIADKGVKDPDKLQAEPMCRMA